MDPISLGFYALICGLLGLASPLLGAPLIRLGIGAVTGIVAVSALPYIRDALGLAAGYPAVLP